MKHLLFALLTFTLFALSESPALSHDTHQHAAHSQPAQQMTCYTCKGVGYGKCGSCRGVDQTAFTCTACRGVKISLMSCARCRGRGAIHNKTCQPCNGSGRRSPCTTCSGSGVRPPCRNCNGVPDRAPCHPCSGSGKTLVVARTAATTRSQTTVVAYGTAAVTTARHTTVAGYGTTRANRYRSARHGGLSTPQNCYTQPRQGVAIQIQSGNTTVIYSRSTPVRNSYSSSSYRYTGSQSAPQSYTTRSWYRGP